MSPTKTLKNSGKLCCSRKRLTIWAKPTYTCVSDGCGWGDVNCLSYRNRPSGVAVFTFGQGFKTWVDLRLFFNAIYCQGKLCFYAKVTQFHCYLSILNAISWFPIKISCMTPWKTVGMSLGQFHCSLLLCDNQNCLYWRQQRFCEYLTLSFSLCGGK